MIELLNAAKSKRKIICITGGLGEGKTLAMSALAKELSQTFTLQNTFSNYGLLHSQDIKALKWIDVYGSTDYTVICLDEGQNVSAFSPAFMAHLMSDFMKSRRVIILLTAGNTNRIHSEFRKHIDVILEVNRETETEQIIVQDRNADFTRSFPISEASKYYDFIADVNDRISV